VRRGDAGAVNVAILRTASDGVPAAPEIVGKPGLTLAESDQQGNLFCPTCNYNLTGLTVLRCPECGSSFQHEAILRLAGSAPKTIGFWAAIVQLLWPPAVFTILGFLFAVSNLEWLYGTLILCIGIYALLNGIEIAQRTTASLSVRSGGSAYFQGNKNRLAWMAVFLVLFQWAVAFAGCGAGAALGHRLF